MAAIPRKLGFIAATLVLGALAIPAFTLAADDSAAPAQPPTAQPPAAQPGDAANPGAGGNGGGFNRGNFQQRIFDRMKELLGSSDDEFKVLQPKLQAVMDLNRQLTGNGMRMLMGGGRRGGGNGGNGGQGGAAQPAQDQPSTPLQDKIKDLQTTLDNKDATADDIKTKLQAVRDARAQVKTDLAKAQADLKDLLTARQEAVLVEAGMLE